MNFTTKLSASKSIKVVFSFLIISLFSSCDKSIETGRVYLTNFEIRFAPYYKGQKVGFVHTNGYNFDFTVTQVKYSFGRDYEYPNNFFNFSGGNYTANQTKTITMVSTYPKLKLEIELGGLTTIYDSILKDDFKPILTDSIKILNIDLNGYYTSLKYFKNGEFVTDSVGQIFFDSITIGGKKYFKVIESELEYHSDSIDASPKSVLINATHLLQIKLCNNETFSIK